MSENAAVPFQLDRAILWVPHPHLTLEHVGGMSVLERQLFTISRAGIESVWIATHRPSETALISLRLPPGLTLHWLENGPQSPPDCLPPYLGVSSDHFIRVATLSEIARQRHQKPLSFDDDRGVSVVAVVPSREDAISSRAKSPMPAASYCRLELPLPNSQTISWLMATGPKSQDGFMARHFDRHISMFVSRLIVETNITPNMMTVVSTLIGLFGTTFFLAPSRASHVVAALLVWLHSVIDGCDGELARVRFQESTFGSDLDFWGDNLVHLALFTCLGLGFWKSGAGAQALVLGVIADVGVIASATTAWQHRVSRRAVNKAMAPEAGVTEAIAGNTLDSKLARLENSLAQRDFIYLLIVLAAVDFVYQFLWAAAVGGLVYFAIMLYLRRRRVHENEQAQQPYPAR